MPLSPGVVVWSYGVCLVMIEHDFHIVFSTFLDLWHDSSESCYMDYVPCEGSG